MNRHYKALELDVILNMLANETACDDARDKALSLKPSYDFKEISKLLDQTEDAFSLIARYGAPSFNSLKNVNNPLQRAASGACLNQKELLEIAGTLRSMRTLDEWHNHCSGVKTSLDGYFDAIVVNKYLETKITSAIINEDEIADKASETLFEIRRKIKAKSASVREKLDSMIRSSHYRKFLQEAIVTQRSGRFVVPVKSECRGEVPGLVHDTSSSGATVFVEPVSVVEANNEIKVLEGEERDEINRILFELSVEAGSFAQSIISSYESAVVINLIFSKAHLAYKMKATKPIVNCEGITDLKKARHPLIDKSKVVPTDIRLGDDFDTLIITGPNTGGKTVSIKTLGLFTLMAQCGLLLPVADRSYIAVYKNILADVGDEQSIAQSLSTFSSHMVNIISIMKKADENSLVLIDELGAGTDPVEGAALAVAIIENIRSKGAKIAATTHYAELKAYALETSGVSNGCCEFDVNTLKPTYKLLIGVPGRSNAFAISEHLGMDKTVVEHAKSIVDSSSRDFENVLKQLEETRVELENEKNIAREKIAQAEELSKKARQQADEIKTLAMRETDRAKKEAQRIVENAKRQSADFLLRLEQLKKEEGKSSALELAKKARREIKSQLGELEETVNPVERSINWDENYVLPRELKVGDSVIIKGLGEGEVLEVGSKILVKAGMIKTRVAKSDVMLSQKKKKSSQPTKRTVYRTTSRTDSDVKTSLDLRGKTVEEALGELEMFIDKCVLNGIGEVTIIHGKGTGALRSAVSDRLRMHPNVSEYRLGVYGEGENGVTIAKIK